MNDQNRYKKARTVYNQHGKQSVAAVVEATGISKTTINELETSVLSKPRKARDTTIIKLAKHYGVNVGYLMGTEKEPTNSMDAIAVHNYTGLSIAAVESLRRMKENPDDNGCLYVLSKLLDGDDFRNVLTNMFNALDTVHRTDNLYWSVVESGADEPGNPFVKMYGTSAAKYHLNDAIRICNVMLSDMYESEVEKLKQKTE